MKYTLKASGPNAAPAVVLALQSATEERWALRRPSRMPGLVWHAGMAEAMPCLVTDTSSTGARLQLAGTKNRAQWDDRMPARLTLTLADRTAVECEIAWKEGDAMGVRFITPTRAVPRAKAARLPKKPQPVKLLALLGLGR